MADLRPLQYDILWDTYNGHPVTDIHFKNFSKAIDFMWNNAFLPNIVYKGINLHEVENMKEQYENYCRHILRNECSVMMLSEDFTQIRAVVLLEWMTEEWHSWTFLPNVVPNGLFQELIRLKKDLMVQTKLQNDWESIDSLMVLEMGYPTYLYYDANFQNCMFDVFASVAEHMHMPRVCFIALTVREQLAAELADFDEYSKSIYSIYKVGRQRPFDVLRDLDEMYAVNFMLPLGPILFYKLMPGFEKFHEALEAQERKEREEAMGRQSEL